MEKLEHIPLRLDLNEIGRKLRLKRDRDWEQVQTLIESVNPLIAAKAVYKVCYIDEKLHDAVIIEGICFKSSVLRNNLENVERVFPYVVSIGSGLEEKDSACNGVLEQYYLDVIGNIALIKARKYLENQLCAKYALDGISYMSPGSLEDWPIEEQRSLFLILKDVESSIGVRLNESFIMLPRKSVSGIYFPTETSFYSCQLCPRKRCEGRKAHYIKKPRASARGIKSRILIV